MTKREIENNLTPKKMKTTDQCTPPKYTITRRKSTLKISNTPNQGTPKRNIKFSETTKECNIDSLGTPKPTLKSINERTPTKTPNKTPSQTSGNIVNKTPKSTSKIKMMRDGQLTPSLAKKEINSLRRKSDAQIMREKLHVSAAPDSLPCRETEYSNIYSFLEGKINDQSGG